MTNVILLTLWWLYPTNAIQPDSFQVYHTTNVAAPVSTWPMITNVPGTSSNVLLSVPWGPNFFAMSASNVYGIGTFSTNLNTAPVATNVPLGIKKP